MKNEEINNYVRVRSHYVISAKISETDLYVEKEMKDYDDVGNKKVYNPKINTGHNGLRYINLSSNKNLKAL